MPASDRGRGAALGLVLLAALLAACFGGRDRPTIPVFGDLAVVSDPAGAEIIVDGRRLQLTTPAVVQGIPAGERWLELVFSPGPAEFFVWRDTVTVPEEMLDTVDAALEGGCGRNCPFLLERNRVRCRSTSHGDTCASVFFDAVRALTWPGPAGGSYGAGGRLLLAGILGADAGEQAGDTVATQVYDLAWLGRQPMRTSTSGRRQTMELSYWASGRFRGESLQGLSVKETLVAVDSAMVEDVLFIQFEVTNVSDDERYQRLYPWVPVGGYTFESLYVGFGLDADVGGSDDDLGTFQPDLGLAFMYDAFLNDPTLGEFAERPALVGTVTIEPPANATERTLTLWRRPDDWDDGNRHGFAWRLLAGRLRAGDPITDHPSPEIGYQPSEPDDYRITQAHGPLRLAPGESFTFSVALLLAEPVPGSYTPGQLVRPGNPLDPNRPILSIAGDLAALSAELPALWARYRP